MRSIASPARIRRRSSRSSRARSRASRPAASCRPCRARVPKPRHGEARSRGASARRDHHRHPARTVAPRPLRRAGRRHARSEDRRGDPRFRNCRQAEGDRRSRARTCCARSCARRSRPRRPRRARAPDPIAELIAPSQRVIAVQRALNDFGYGPLKATGNYGSETDLGDPEVRARPQAAGHRPDLAAAVA